MVFAQRPTCSCEHWSGTSYVRMRCQSCTVTTWRCSLSDLAASRSQPISEAISECGWASIRRQARRFGAARSGGKRSLLGRMYWTWIDARPQRALTVSRMPWVGKPCMDSMFQSVICRSCLDSKAWSFKPTELAIGLPRTEQVDVQISQLVNSATNEGSEMALSAVPECTCLASIACG